MSYHESLVIITLAFLILATVSLISYRKKYYHTQKQYNQLSDNNALLAEQCRTLQERIDRNESFSKKLSKAEIANKFQAPPGNVQSARISPPPERYRYVQRLSENGMSGDQIADILALSRREVEQLVTLSRLCTRSS